MELCNMVYIFNHLVQLQQRNENHFSAKEWTESTHIESFSLAQTYSHFHYQCPFEISCQISRINCSICIATVPCHSKFVYRNASGFWLRPHSDRAVARPVKSSWKDCFGRVCAEQSDFLLALDWCWFEGWSVILYVGTVPSPRGW